ncbi:MAG: UvrD-helicase domain-containing protein [Ignavibacteriae bacterium]|nr:UvrD-helicase domain-containing protein [Ignavibacteriota bacterium]
MSIIDELNPIQREAVKTVEGPVLVLAGPGSGKTRVLTYRIAHLMNIGVPAYQILALTFTNKAASEMKGRIVELVGEKSNHLWMGTFHSIFARILRCEAEKLGYTKHFSIYDTTDSHSVICNLMDLLGISPQQYHPQAIRARISHAKNLLVSPEMFARDASDVFEEKTAIVFKEYEKKLKVNNAMDFDDLLVKPIELFEHHKKVLETYQERFRFILVDEYQDTNHAQYVLIKHLAARYRNLCIVGDDAQSIYGFRGADIRNILDFKHDYPDANIVNLEQNYRSTQTILAAADQVIKKNIDQLTKHLWTDNPKGEPITVLICQDDQHEGSMIVSRIFDDVSRLKIDFKDIAIMYRTNAQSRSIEDSLRRNSIPYVIIGGIEFYQRKEVKDVLAYLQLIVNPRDEESFMRIVNYPNRGLGETALGRLQQFASSKQLPLLEAARRANELESLTQKAKDNFTLFALLIHKYIQLKDSMSASELSRAVVDEVGILQMFKEEGTPEALARRENIQELLSAISEFSAQEADTTLAQFLEQVSLLSDVDQWDDKHNTVTLMTLHSAKGLEFPVVFISGVEEGLLPFSDSTFETKSVEEERRLLYVGITRAKVKLYLSYSRQRFRFGGVSYQVPSRFLGEISEELIQTTDYTRDSYVQRLRYKKREYSTTKQTSYYFTDDLPDYEQKYVEPVELHVGNFVEHDIFGKGKIIEIMGPKDSLKAVVDFQAVGRKNLMVKYARLKVI